MMHKAMLILMTLMTICTVGTAQPEETTREGKTVSETLKSMKGQWRMMYKIMEDNIIYDRHYQINPETNRYELRKDTSSIHTFDITRLGRTSYKVNREDSGGQLVVNDWDISGSWDLKQTDKGIDLHIMNAYYDGCPTVVRRIVNVNDRQLWLQDPETGTQYYYVRK